MNSHSLRGIQRHSMSRGPLPLLCWRNSAASEIRPPMLRQLEKGEGQGRERGAREDMEGRFPEERGLGVFLGGKRPASVYTPPTPLHTHHTHTGALVRCGYVAGWSGLLTGLPPFITAGSLVLLLGGTAALGTVSPTSCNDGSRYMATGGEEDRAERQVRRWSNSSILP